MLGKSGIGRVAYGAALCGSALLIGGTSSPVAAKDIDWSMAGSHFLFGEAAATSVYTRKEASACVGRWRLHADAVDDGAFPDGVVEKFPESLRLVSAVGSAEFFLLDVNVPEIMRAASDEAEQRLRRALGGDEEAFRAYFEALGRCSSKPESAGDGVIDGKMVGDVEGPAEGSAGGPANPSG